jgi:hypothetical protein
VIEREITASARLRASSLRKMWLTCVLTVPAPSTSRSAMSAFVSPVAISSSWVEIAPRAASAASFRLAPAVEPLARSHLCCTKETVVACHIHAPGGCRQGVAHGQ